MLSRGTLLYIAQRVVLIAFTLVAVSFFVFITVHSLPGSAFESQRVHGKALQLLLHEYGLDRPILVQYWSFLTSAIHGDLGVSFQIRGLPITPLVMRELSVSAELGGTALLITIGLGTTFGVIAAMRQNTWVDYTLTSIAVIGYSVPSFVLAGLGVLIFSYFLPTLTGGVISYPAIWTGTYGTLVELSLPAVILGFYTSGQVTRITRAAMLEVLQQDYIRTAKAKGLRTRVVDDSPRISERPHSCDQHPRSAGHQHHHGERHHRDDLRYSRSGQGVRGEHHGSRLQHHGGGVHRVRVAHRHRESPRRPAVHGRRPEDPVLMAAVVAPVLRGVRRWDRRPGAGRAVARRVPPPQAQPSRARVD